MISASVAFRSFPTVAVLVRKLMICSSIVLFRIWRFFVNLMPQWSWCEIRSAHIYIVYGHQRFLWGIFYSIVAFLKRPRLSQRPTVQQSKNVMSAGRSIVDLSADISYSGSNVYMVGIYTYKTFLQTAKSSTHRLQKLREIDWFSTIYNSCLTF